MAIFTNITPPLVQFVASGGQTIFSFNFPFLNNSDIYVYYRLSSQDPDDATQLLTLNTDYTLTGVNTNPGGVVTLSAASFPSGATANAILTIIRLTSNAMSVSFSNLAEFSADDLNTAMNYLQLTSQENAMLINRRGLTYQRSAPYAAALNLLPEWLTNGFLKYDGSGITSVTLEESAGYSTLRSDLANNSNGTDGARLVGYYSSTLGPTTVKNQLDAFVSPTFPVADTTNIVKNAADATKLARISAASIPTSTVVTVTWPGANLDLGALNTTVAGITPALKGSMAGFVCSVNATDPDHDIDIGKGAARDVSNTYTLSLTSALVKQLDGIWSAGSGNGGRPAAVALAADTTYYIFVIYDSGSGTTDGGFDTDIAAANLLAASSYEGYRLVGLVITDGSQNIRKFKMYDNWYWWDASIADYAADPGAAGDYTVTLTNSAPNGLDVLGAFTVSAATNNNQIYLRGFNQPTVTHTNYYDAPIVNLKANANAVVEGTVLSSIDDQQVKFQVPTGAYFAGDVYIQCRGFYINFADLWRL